MVKKHLSVNFFREGINLLQEPIDSHKRRDLVKMIQVVRVLLQVENQNSLRQVFLKFIFQIRTFTFGQERIVTRPIFDVAVRPMFDFDLWHTLFFYYYEL